MLSLNLINTAFLKPHADTAIFPSHFLVDQLGHKSYL